MILSFERVHDKNAQSLIESGRRVEGVPVSMPSAGSQHLLLSELRWIVVIALVMLAGPQRGASQAMQDQMAEDQQSPAFSATETAPRADSSSPSLPEAPLPMRLAAEPSFHPSDPEARLDRNSVAARIAGLPAFDPAAWSSSTASSLDLSIEPVPHGGYVPLKDCPTDETHAHECRMHWGPLAIEAVLFNAFDNGGNVYTGYWYREETLTGKWWDRYVASVEGWRWSHWSDNNPFLDDYVGHPMMGAITNSIWIQNDPKGMTLEFQNDRAYWHSRLRALAWSTFYSFEWKLGPLGEASIGHNGDHYFSDEGAYTNETGWVELVTTPVGGLGWTVVEDYLDKHVVTRLEEKSHNPVLLTMDNFLTPARGFANILRFRPPWYRDSRVVKANSFWSDAGDGVTASTAEAMRWASRHPDSGAETYVASVEPAVSGPPPPGWEGPGGKHEFGTWWGLSVMSGHIWGYSGDVKYMPIDLRYSYEFYRHHESWTMRYSPEMTALAMIDWPTPNATSTGTVFNQRTRAYGSGISPVGFQADFLPLHRVQPFLSTDGGFIYFDKQVLSPQRWWMMRPPIDFTGLASTYSTEQGDQAITTIFYQHLSNANISVHNPGTDANTFYVGVSRFRTKGDRRPERGLR